MIFFVPGYDAPTHANLTIARELFGSALMGSWACMPLLKDQATRQALFVALDRTGWPLFAMSHGSSDQLFAQDGDIALAEGDVAKLGCRPVYAFACYTASRLGQEAAQLGTTWWGYTGIIQSPVAEAPFSALFTEIFGYLAAVFAPAQTTVERLCVLEELAQMCQAAQEEVDRHASEQPDLDVQEAHLCLLQLWDRLRVWTPGAQQPEKHPAAQHPLLLM